MKQRLSFRRIPSDKIGGFGDGPIVEVYDKINHKILAYISTYKDDEIIYYPRPVTIDVSSQIFNEWQEQFGITRVEQALCQT